MAEQEYGLIQRSWQRQCEARRAALYCVFILEQHQTFRNAVIPSLWLWIKLPCRPIAQDLQRATSLSSLCLTYVWRQRVHLPKKVTVCTFVSCHASNIRGNPALQFVETASSQTAIIDFVKCFVRMCVDSTSRVTFLSSANLWDVGNGHWWRQQDVYGVLSCVYVSLVLWVRKLPLLTVR